MGRVLSGVTLSVSTLLVGVPAAAEPFGSPGHPLTREVREGVPHVRAPSAALLRPATAVYRHVLSPIDGARCPHRPTCSHYMLAALQRHGIVGLWLGYDRLYRDARSSAAALLPVRIERGRLFYLDPLEESTFWWR